MAITPKPPGSISPPNNATEVSSSPVAIPNNATEVTSGSVAIPKNLSEVSPGSAAVPRNLSEVSTISAGVPNNATEVSAGTVAVPRDAAAVTASGFPRTLTPLVDMDFVNDSYAQAGTPISFDSLFTYARSSSATFINRRIDRLGRYEYFLDTDYVGNATNLVTYSEQFDNAAWTNTNSSVQPDKIAGPFSSGLAEKLTDDSTNDLHSLNSNTINITSGNKYTASFYVKNIDINVVRIDFSGFSNWVGSPYAAFNIKTGVLIKVGSDDIEASISYISNGWYLITMTAQASSTATVESKLVMTNGQPDGVTYIGSNESLYIWGAQLTESAKPLPYVKTLAAAVTETFSESIRREYNPVTGEALGALIEGVSTNLALRSEEFDNASWTKSSVTISDNLDKAPDGTISADKFIGANGVSLQSCRVEQTLSIAAGVKTFTYSVYAKPGGFDSILLLAFGASAANSISVKVNLIDGTNEVIDASGNYVTTGSSVSVQDFSNGYKRVNFTFRSNGDSALSVQIYSEDSVATLGDGTRGIYIWGAQVEQLPFATSYIRTEGAIASRSTDSISLPSAGNFNPHEYTISVTGLSNDISDFRNILSVSDLSVNNRIQLSTGLNKAGLNGVSAGVTQFNYNSGSPDLETKKLTLTFTPNNVNYYLDGVSIHSDTNASATTAVSIIHIGSLFGTIEFLYGNVEKVSIYNKALTAQEVSLL